MGLIMSAIFDLLKVCLAMVSIGVLLLLVMMVIVCKLGVVGFCISFLLLFFLIIKIINKI